MIIKKALYILLFFAATLNAQTPEPALPTKGLLFEISGNGLTRPSYLFGTFHLMKSEYFDEHPRIETCLERVEGLVVEVDMVPSAFKKVQKAMYMEDTLITDFLNEAEELALDRKLIDNTGNGISTYNTFKPSSVLSLIQPDIVGETNSKYKSYKGEVMDIYLTEKAKDADMDFEPLETVEEQISILYNEPFELQIAQLKKYIFVDIKLTTPSDTVGLSIIDMYFTENIGGMYANVVHQPERLGNVDRILHQRNNNWMERLPGMIKEKSRFIAVGALHLPGPTGLVYQLQKAGFTLKVVSLK